MASVAQVPYRVGQWLPSDQVFLARWLEAMVEKTRAQPRALHPVIADLKQRSRQTPRSSCMAEVSSCQITVYEGQRVRKGDQIGMFHYGGSTHCLVFRPGVKLQFDHHGQTPGLHAANIHVNARIATVVR